MYGSQVYAVQTWNIIGICPRSAAPIGDVQAVVCGRARSQLWQCDSAHVHGRDKMSVPGAESRVNLARLSPTFRLAIGLNNRKGPFVSSAVSVSEKISIRQHLRNMAETSDEIHTRAKREAARD